MTDDSVVSDLWSKFAEDRRAPGTEAWMFALDHPTLRKRIYETYLGGADPFTWVRGRLPHLPAREALEIGCGGGNLAMAMVETGLCHSLEAFDLAEGAIRIAAERAAAQGLDINFHVADANTIKLPRRQYDFICASHSLHHIENLEHLFEQVAGALTPDGLFFADDYIGPSRMQWSDTQLTLMNQLLRCLPERKRISRVNGGTVKRLIERVPLENFLRIDPSEGVRAADIVPVARQFLDVEVVPIGMGIIFEVLFGIIHNFEVGNDDDEALLDLACLVNQVTEEAGLIDPCFACLVGRSKGSPGFDLRTI